MEYSLVIRPLTSLPHGIVRLRVEAAEEGFQFIGRLEREWEAGTNRFDAPGEVFIGAFAGNRLLGVGGVNADPYASDTHTGRLRHLYVLKSARREGIGSSLVQHLVGAAAGHFTRIRLHSDTEEGAMFYDGLGFSRSASSTASHVLLLPDPNPFALRECDRGA